MFLSNDEHNYKSKESTRVDLLVSDRFESRIIWLELVSSGSQLLYFQVQLFQRIVIVNLKSSVD